MAGEDGGRKVLKVGVVGLGGMGQGHCKRILDLVPEMQLAAVCDQHAPTAEKVGADFKVPHFVSHQELLAARGCEAVIIATPHPFHPMVALDALAAGLHVLTEKPLSERVKTAEQMVRTAARKKRTLGVIFQSRYAGPNRKALELMQSGALGRIHRVTALVPDYRTQAYYDAGGWRATWKGEGGGVLLNQSPHMVDLLVNLTGLPEKVRGRTTTLLHDIEVEDLADAALTYPGGGIGYLYCSTVEPQGGDGVQIAIAGENGKLLLGGGAVRFFKYPQPVSAFTRESKEMWGRLKAEEVPLEYSKEHPAHEAVMRNFARHLLHGEELLCSGESALAQIELANAIILSAHLGKEVSLPISRRAYDRLLDRLRAGSRAKEKRPGEDLRQTDPSFQRK
jgi:predicted dehydrogenase